MVKQLNDVTTHEVLVSPITFETRCDESAAFPAELRAVRDAVALVVTGEAQPPRGAFLVNVDGETLHIPSRLYYSPALLRREIRNAQGIVRLILAALGTRHYDGYLRQLCLRELLRSDDAWLTPYILALASDYVAEIAKDVAEAIPMRDTAALAAFARGNPEYLATLACFSQSTGVQKGAPPNQFFDLAYRSSDCSGPVIGQMDLGMLKDLTYARCGAPASVTLRGWAGFLEVDDALVPTDEAKVDFSSFGGAAACTITPSMRVYSL